MSVSGRMSSLSPEPLIDLSNNSSSEQEDNLSLLSNNSCTSSTSSNANNKRRPPPPPPSSTKPPLLRSTTDIDLSNGTVSKPVMSSVKPGGGAISKPLPPPPPRNKLGRTVSMPPTRGPVANEVTTGHTRSPPLPPPRKPAPPEKPRRISYREQSPPEPTDPPPQLIDANTSLSNDVHNETTPTVIPEGELISLDSPPASVEHKPASLTSQSEFRRAQPVCLPKPVSRELEYEEKDHPKNAFKQLEKFRQNGDLCDCILLVGDIEIKAHRVVLASCSGYFESMFIGEFAEPEGVPVVIEEVDEISLRTLIDFAYTSRIVLSQSNVYNLFEAADILEFQGIKNACFRFFKSQMNKTNCIRTWMFAESHNCTELLDASLKYIEVNFLSIVRGKEFLAIEPDTVCRLLETGRHCYNL